MSETRWGKRPKSYPENVELFRAVPVASCNETTAPQFEPRRCILSSVPSQPFRPVPGPSFPSLFHPALYIVTARSLGSTILRKKGLKTSVRRTRQPRSYRELCICIYTHSHAICVLRKVGMRSCWPASLEKPR